MTFSPGSACTQTGDTITCTGDLSSGVDVEISPPDTVSTLIVSSSTPISVSALSGIEFQSEGVIVITSEAVIVSQAAGGIEATSFGNPNGGDVTVTQIGDITSGGGDAGIFASSNVDNTSHSPTDAAGNVAVTQTGNITALGGRGIYAWSRAASGIAGSVTVTQAGNISAFGDGISAVSDGAAHLVGGDVTVTQTGNIFAQGNGIWAVSGAAAIAGTAGDVTVTQTGNITTQGHGIGASSAGGEDGTAGRVTVTQRGNISTQINNAFGITAYSAINGGYAGTAGDVTVMQTGNITTQGEDAYGIQAYASTFDGATGRVAVVQTGKITTHGDGAYAIEAYTTSDHGNADDVTVSQTGNITTHGDDAYAIEVYSRAVDGTAGDVVVTQSGDITTTGTNSFGVSASSLDGLVGSNVTVTRVGNLTTLGDGAYGIFASSRGETAGGDVTVSQTGIISTHGDSAYGIQAVSTTAHGTAGHAAVTQIGDIVTTGADSSGIRAVSGGGAVGGVVTVTGKGNITTHGDNAYGISASSSGETAGGAVTVSLTGNITTQDDGAYGIFATSSALDPGLGSFTAGDITVTQTGNITIGGGHGIFAWSATGSGTAGNVTVTQNGNITTSGSYVGIRAFSESEEISGRVTVTQTGDISAQGGGILAVSTAAAGHTGTANDVTVTHTGNIATLNDGIQAGSAGGANGTAGHVTVTQSGEINAGGHGIFANIHGLAGTGSIVVNLTGSTIQGGGSSSAGVRLEGLTSTSGTLNSYGVTTISAVSGTAVSATDGNDTINNFGVLTTVGTVDLGAGTNFINNMAGATYNSGTAINLGAGNLFTNAGTLSPGGSNVIATTSITGTFVQTSSGQLLTDINLANGTGDLTTVSGTASLAGKVRVRATDIALDQRQITFFSAAGGTTDDDLGLISSPALHTSLLFPNANDVAVVAYIDFMPASMGLNHNQTDLANYFNRAAAAGSPGLNSLLLALVNGPSNMTEYKFALNQLLPAVFLNSETTSMLSSAEFSNDLFSCNVAGTGNAFIRQDECLWVRPKSRRFDSDGTSQNIGFDDRATGLSAGAQFRFAPDWFATVALGYERGNTETSAGAKSESDHYQLGLGLKYQTGSWLFAGAVSGGMAQFETRRTIAFPEFAGAVAQSDPDISFVTGQLRAAYLSDFGTWYAKPLVDMRVTYLDRDAVTETGGGQANLWVSGASETSYSISPAVEFGTEYAVGLGTAMKPFLKTGITYIADTHSSLTAGFLGAAPGVEGFTIDSDMDDLYADLEAGVQFFDQDGSTLSFGYKDMISEDTRQNSVFAKGTMKF